jgi:hypothetical protein
VHLRLQKSGRPGGLGQIFQIGFWSSHFRQKIYLLKALRGFERLSFLIVLTPNANIAYSKKNTLIKKVLNPEVQK